MAPKSTSFPAQSNAVTQQPKPTLSAVPAATLPTPAPLLKTGPTQEQIAKRAHEKFLARKGSHGRDLEDWYAAERELKAQFRS
jgi:hypothetical protein